ncbi:MAG TPA: HlyD family efflux transporter periplasmic adaptor subunit [Bryobacteraceae bacterium]|jgi:HlyD family secretion protein|nr:HlyD family efflux transporter periplasmic adaptor subunit [Bryobacteraceae bacterium]
MDIPRGKEVGRRRVIRRTILIIFGLIAISGITYGLKKLKPAAPTVELATVWPDTVKRGPMLRQVRGLGTLVSENPVWIQANFDGRVDKILHRPGEVVRANDVLIVLTNPDMELAATDLEWQVKAAEATYRDLKVQLKTKQLQQKSTTEQTHSDYTQAKLTADRDEQLTKLGLKSELETKLSVAKAQELLNSYDLSKQQLDISDESVQAQLDASKVAIEKLRAAWELKKRQVEQLTIRAGVDGTLIQLGTALQPLEEGQRVAPGGILAKVAEPSKLKATLKIPETQVKDVTIGQEASIDTRNGFIPGHVMRIDPAASNGTFDVDVKLDGALPPGARPDLSVDGTIDIEKLADVVYVGRPVIGQSGQKISLFKIDPDGKGATRTTVTLGRASVNTIEIVDGLKVGDRVILSDMSQWDGQNRIRLN